MPIERRQGRSIANYLVRHPEYFERFDRLNHRESVLVNDVKEALVEPWDLQRKGVWVHVTHPDLETPTQGFKIHLSAIPQTAREILQIALDVCTGHQTAFKFLRDRSLVEHTIGKNYPRPQSGKFVTIYPKDVDCLKDVIEVLHARTDHLAGPHILSDQRYKNNQVLYYRYGGIRPLRHLNIFGEETGLIETPNGEKVPDIRQPYFELPDWVEPPFGEPSEEESSDARLNDRYEIVDVLTHSNSGGVYGATDRETDETVILKEARPFVNQKRGSSLDAVARLKMEYDFLTRLKDVDCVINAIDYFEEWEHHFLVEEQAAGVRLTSFRSSEDFSPVLSHNPSPSFIQDSCETFNKIARNLIEAVGEVHDRGVIIGDLSPTNVFVDDSTYEVTLIDFGSASDIEHGLNVEDVEYTVGFVSEDRFEGESGTVTMEPSDDYYALGATLYSLIFPIQAYLNLNPSATWALLEHVSRDSGLPAYVSAVIRALIEEADPENALALLDESESGSTDYALEASSTLNGSAVDEGSTISAEDAVSQIGENLLATMEPERNDRLWPSDYRVFGTNPLSLAYGALGPAIFLNTTRGEIPDIARDWILSKEVSIDDYAPGLFVGMSGIAWGFDLLGWTERGEEVLKEAYQSQLLNEGPDIFYGEAGIGLAHLHFWRRTENETYLERASELGRSLMEKAHGTPNGPAWRNVDGQVHLGYAHGGSGIAYFFLKLHEETGDEQFLQMANRSLQRELAHGNLRDDPERWLWPITADRTVLYSYWRHGSAGIGSVLARFYETLGDDSYAEYFDRIANEVHRKYTVFPSQFDGVSGLGECLVDFYNVTGKKKYLDLAKDLQSVTLFAIPREQGIAFPGQDLFRIAHDYGTGSAGIGLFLYRLTNPELPRVFHDLGASAFASATHS